MKLSVSREEVLAPLHLVAGVVERRQTLPILANVLLQAEGDQLLITGTDLEVELVAAIPLSEPVEEAGDITVPARKLVDICKSLADGSQLNITSQESRVTIHSGSSRFTLSSLPSADFPKVPPVESLQKIVVKQGDLKRLIDRTSFAMAQQDVRYYLNGMLWEIEKGALRLVATDGHRLATCCFESKVVAVNEPVQAILPRKGVLELAKLLTSDEDSVEISIGSNHLHATVGDYHFTSKLVDGKFPDYQRVLPRSADKEVLAERAPLRQTLSRVAILSNEKYRGIRLILSSGELQISANNPEQEEAEEKFAIEYQGEKLEIGFNVNYILDVLAVISGDQVKISLSDSNSSALIEESEKGDSLYVVMPMRL